MHCRCPHCHNPIELVGTETLVEMECPTCGSSFKLLGDESTSATLPQQIRTMGRFRLLTQVGIGSFGTVWKARDTELDRVVAVKLPRLANLSEEQTSQFAREARAAAQIKRESIVTVHEVGRVDDQIFIVSDFVEGANLAEWLTVHSLSGREAAGLCATLALAIHAAHEAGVVHRDLKPSNIMLDGNGKPFIADFGLAKREAGEITMTIEGKVVGTPAYMSPEQAKGNAHQADRRQYSMLQPRWSLLRFGERRRDAPTVGRLFGPLSADFSRVHRLGQVSMLQPRWSLLPFGQL